MSTIETSKKASDQKIGRRVLAFLAVALLAAGCVTARVEEVEPGRGGVISVSNPNKPKARKKAMALMQENCGDKRPKIVREGYQVVGTDTYSSSQSSRDQYYPGDVSSSSSSSTRAAKEWQLKYKCVSH